MREQKQIMTHSNYGTLLSNKKEHIIHLHNMDDSHRQYTEQKKLDSKSIYCMIPLTRCSQTNLWFKQLKS